MASQREFESVVWYWVRRHLEKASIEEVKDGFYSSSALPHTATQEKRFEAAIAKVTEQMVKFEGDERP